MSGSIHTHTKHLVELKGARTRKAVPVLVSLGFFEQIGQPVVNACQLVLKSLDNDLAQEIVTIDLAGKSALADHMVVATGRSQRHVGAVADHLLRKLKEDGHKLVGYGASGRTNTIA